MALMAATAYLSNIPSDYRSLGLVGQGQFAQVYCGVHRRSGQLVAIKQTRHASEDASQEPFVLHDLSHPNIVGCQAIARANGGNQFILDYCEGGTLRSHLTTAGPLSLTATKALIGDILKGLHYIHQQQIIHGDLKPENIFLTHTALSSAERTQNSARQQISLTAKIGDFGSARFVARATRSRREIGSPTYAAPERFEGSAVYASDLYSVGVMLYELLLGDRPFSGSPEALRQAHQTQPILLPDTLSQPAKQLLLTALQKQPSRRFVSAEAMLTDLRNLSALHLAENNSVTTPLSATPTSITSLNSVSVSRALTRISLTGISDPIESLVTVPQGCCVITARSLHVLTPQQALLPIAQFSQDCWTIVSPNGQWFVTLPKPLQPRSQHKSQGRFYAISHSDICSKPFSAKTLTAVPCLPIVLTSPLLTALRSDIVQVLAIDSRHLLQVRTVQLASYAGQAKRTMKTYLECFTRRGQFVGQLSLNLWITHMTPTAMPYQFIALVRAAGASVESCPTTAALVTLKPFQVRHLRLPMNPDRVSTFPWGCLITNEHKALLLDRSSEPVSRLTEVPLVSAITAMGSHQLLMASVSDPLALFLADLTQLDLDLIF